MNWNKDPDKAFPARHPREPGGLRQDILDEIADHLACAAERELERGNDDEDTVRRRVLEQFGDPDAIARKLWWDHMREIVMREWIQTGVMVVMTVAVLAGLFLMMRLVGGVGTSNDAMRTAMEQVAASNQALATAMAEQRAGNEALLTALSGIRGGGEASPELELSTIEIVVRRGTPEGPPAPEVKVEMRGSGPNDGSLTVDGELDASGRAEFERLYQGAYTFSFEDPISGLFSEKQITIFAGKGAGEHVIVAPDVTPRPVHIDWGLPAYARDEEQLIGTVLAASWGYDDVTWSSLTGVLMGHGGTRAFSETARSPKRWHDASRVFATNTSPTSSSRVQHDRQARLTWEEYPGCTLAGHVAVVDYLVVLSRTATETWNSGSRVVLDRSVFEGSAPSEYPRSEPPVLTETSAGQFTGELPDSLHSDYLKTARNFRNTSNVPGEQYKEVIRAVSSEWTESLVSGMATPPELRHAYIVDDRLLGTGATGDSNTLDVGRDFENGLDQVAVIVLPDISAMSETNTRGLWLAVNIDGIGRGRLSPEQAKTDGIVRPSRSSRMIGLNVERVSDVAGNSLSAYAIRSNLLGLAWPEWEADTQTDGVSLDVDEEPFWQVDAAELSENVGFSYIRVPDALFVDGTNPPTAIMLRWEEHEGEDRWQARFWKVSAGSEPENMFCWLTFKPIEAVGGQPLNDIDGRFHHDGLRPKELEPNQPRPSNPERPNSAPVSPDAVSPKPAED